MKRPAWRSLAIRQIAMMAPDHRVALLLERIGRIRHGAFKRAQKIARGWFKAANYRG